MDPTPKIKLPIPYKSLEKIDTKLKSLSKIGTEKICVKMKTRKQKIKE